MSLSQCRLAQRGLAVRLAAVVLVFAIDGCRSATDPSLPNTAVRLTPPPIYARWWSMTEVCSGITRPLAAVTWYVVPGVLKVSNGVQDVDAYWSPRSNRVVIVQGEYLIGSLVRHEMLHALLRVSGHPRSAFLKRCAGVVDCGDQCVRDAGPVPQLDPTAVRVPLSAVQLTGDVAPAADGFVAYTIRVRNPAPYPVLVTSSTRPNDAAHLPGFGYIVSSPAATKSGGTPAADPASVVFASGETKSWTFDFALAPALTGLGQLPGQGFSGVALGPGHYTIRGTYGGAWSDSVGVTVGP